MNPEDSVRNATPDAHPMSSRPGELHLVHAGQVLGPEVDHEGRILHARRRPLPLHLDLDGEAGGDPEGRLVPVPGADHDVLQDRRPPLVPETEVVDPGGGKAEPHRAGLLQVGGEGVGLLVGPSLAGPEGVDDPVLRGGPVGVDHGDDDRGGRGGLPGGRCRGGSRGGGGGGFPARRRGGPGGGRGDGIPGGRDPCGLSSPETGASR